MMVLWNYLFLTTCVRFAIFTNAADGDVQLVGRPMTYMGRVEIEFGSTWYSICDVGWGIEEADVVCRQLGFPDGAMFSSVSQRSDFGIGTGNILWSNYACSGTESDFSSCDSGASLSSSECDISQDVAIICNVPAYLGCYDIPSDEYPPELKRTSSSTGSIELCLEACRPHATYAALGIQDDTERCFCFAGDYNTLTAVSNKRCNTPCADDDRAACGGLNAYSVYPVKLGEPGATYTDVDTDFIYSPNFFGLYKPDMDTIWTLVYSNRKIVTVKSIMFLLVNGDSLTFSDGTLSTYNSNRASVEWTSTLTSTVTIQFTTADDSDGNFGFLLEYSTSDAPIVTTGRFTTGSSTTKKAVTTDRAITTRQEEPKTTLADTTTSKTTEADGKTTIEVTATTAATDLTVMPTSEDAGNPTTVEATPTVDAPTTMNTEPACPVLFGSNSISNQIKSDITDQLIIAYDIPFKCDTVVTELSLYASAQTLYTLLVLRQSQDDFTVVSTVDITSSSPGVVVQDLTTSPTLVVANAGDFVGIAFASGSFSFSEDHSGTMNFTVYDTEYSDFDVLIIGDTLDLPDNSMNVKRQYPFQLTMKPAKVCDLSNDPEGGSYSVSILLESQTTTLVCQDGYRAEFEDGSDNDDYDYINVTCTVDGEVVHSGSCKDDSHNTTYIVIFTTIVACLGFCLIIIYCAIICSKPDKTSGDLSDDVEKAPSDENQLLPMDNPEDDVDYPADEAQENEEAQGDNEAVDEDANEPEETGSHENGDGEQSNAASSAGEVEDVDNPLYESNDAMNKNEWVPEEAGPDD